MSSHLLKTTPKHSPRRLQTSPNSISSLSSSPTSPGQPFISFPYNNFPFSDRSNPLPSRISSLKTIPPFIFTSPQLQKLVNTVHPNIINLTKIVKTSSPSLKANGSPPHKSYPQQFYTFFYEPVSYSILALTKKPDLNNKIVDILVKQVSLQNIFGNVANFLQEIGIFYTIRVQDIGISQDATIKIYIPPSAVLDNQWGQDRNKKGVINVTQWWRQQKQILISTLKIKDRKYYNDFSTVKLAPRLPTKVLEPPKLVHTQDMTDYDQLSVRQSLLQKQLSQLLDCPVHMIQATVKKQQNISNNKINALKDSVSSSLTKLESKQQQKIDKINNQIKDIRSRIKMQQEKHINGYLSPQKDSKKKVEDTLKGSKLNERAKLVQSTNLNESKQLSNTRANTALPSSTIAPNTSTNPTKPVLLSPIAHPNRTSAFSTHNNINCINIYNHNEYQNKPQQIESPLEIYRQKSPRTPYLTIKQKPTMKQTKNNIGAYGSKPQNYGYYADEEGGYEEEYYEDDDYSLDTYQIQFEQHADIQHHHSKKHPKNHLPRTSNPFRHSVLTPQNPTSPRPSHPFKDPTSTNLIQPNKNCTESAGPLQFKSIVNKYIRQTEEQKVETTYHNDNRTSISVERGIKMKQQITNNCQNNNIKRNYSQCDVNMYQQHPMNGTGDSEIQEKVRKALEKTKNAIALLDKVKKIKIQQNQLKIAKSVI